MFLQNSESLTLSRLIDRKLMLSVASSLTGVGSSVFPLPFGLSGCVTTAATSYPASASARKWLHCKIRCSHINNLHIIVCSSFLPLCTGLPVNTFSFFLIISWYLCSSPSTRSGIHLSIQMVEFMTECTWPEVRFPFIDLLHSCPSSMGFYFHIVLVL